jgi:UPF0755 protein
MIEERANAGGSGGRRRRLGLALGLAALALLLAVAATAAWFVFLRSAPLPAGRKVEVTIPAGSDTRAIAVRLANDGVVANANMFRLRSRLDGADGRLKSGTYQFTTGSDYESVILRLEEGGSVAYVDVPIPEGFTVRQIAARLQARAGVSGAEFQRLALTGADGFKAKHAFLRDDTTPSLEGYLFPKTYRIKRGTSATDVIDTMLDQFGTETSGLDLSYARSRGVTLHGVVTIASIIEHEAGIPRQRPLVASVVYNRLRLHMYLGLDSVLGYVFGSKTLTYADLRVDSPYNTYRNKGLPPTPIASPGMATLEAAAHPTKTSYQYFVGTARDGTLTFTVTYADFLKAKAVSKRVLGN